MEEQKKKPGRPRGKTVRSICLTLPPVVLDAIDHYASARQITRSAAFVELMINSVPVINNTADFLIEASKEAAKAPQDTAKKLQEALTAAIGRVNYKQGELPLYGGPSHAPSM